MEDDKHCVFLPRINRRSIALDHARTQALLSQLTHREEEVQDDEGPSDSNINAIKTSLVSNARTAQPPLIYEIKNYHAPDPRSRQQYFLVNTGGTFDTNPDPYGMKENTQAPH